MKTWFMPVCFGMLVGYLFAKQGVQQKPECTITVHDAVARVPAPHFPQWFTVSNIALLGPDAEKEREKYINNGWIEMHGTASEGRYFVRGFETTDQ